MFPQKLREDPLLLDKLRRQLSSDLSVLSDRSQQERLLLQIAVGAARRRLYLSYPRLEVAEARARVPSFYALDVARSITGHVPDYEVLSQRGRTGRRQPAGVASPTRPVRGNRRCGIRSGYGLAAPEYEPAAGGTAGLCHETQFAPEEVAARPLGAMAGKVVRA